MESNFEEVLKELGQFGRFQLYNYVLIALPITFSAFFDLSYVFTAGDVDYRCLVAECDGSPPRYRSDWFDTAVPLDGTKLSRCKRFAPLNWTLHQNETATCELGNTTVECDSWVYDETESTVASEFQLTCDIEWKRNFVGTVNNIGQFVGLPITGILSDRIGRKTALVVALCLTCMMGVVRSFAWSYESFAVFESLDPLVSAGVYSTSFVLGMELVGPDKRVLAGTVISVFYAVGEALLGALAMWLRSWRLLLRTTYLPALVFISYIWLIPESVRWLVSKGKLHKAEEILRHAAKKNGVALGDNVLHKIELVSLNKEDVEEQLPKEEGSVGLVRGILTSRVLLLRFITCCFCWLASAFVFFGLTLNSVVVAGDKYVNFMMVGLIEVPAYVVIYFTMDRFRRRYYQAACLALCCASLLVFSFAPIGLEWFRLVLFFLSKMVITVSYTALYVYTAEMFPTPIRHSVITVSCMLSRLGTMVAPLTPLLMKYGESIPLLLFAGMSLFAAILALFFPETLGRNLPDTVEEAENVGKTRS
ncbi:organic cation transporter protein-like isoform X4 [Bacillus rossius redtenbacheri]